MTARALIAVANGALLTLVMASRLVFGMARDGLLPGALSRVLPRRRTPGVAIVATTAVAMRPVVTGDLTALAETVVLLLLVVFTSTAQGGRRPRPRPRAGFARAGLLLLVGLVLYGLARLTGASGVPTDPYPAQDAAAGSEQRA